MFKAKANSELILVNHTENKIELKLTKPEGFDFKAGQYGTFKILDAKGDTTRTFSFASSPKEKELWVGTQHGDTPSKYKAALLSLKPGHPFEIKGPYGDFVWKEVEKEAVMVALGVGVTPIRSMLIDRDDLTGVTLLYSGSSHKLYLDELKALKSRGLNVVETTHRDELIQALEVTPPKETTAYYVSGSMKAVGAVTKHLKTLGVKGKHIYSDIFTGY